MVQNCGLQRYLVYLSLSSTLPKWSLSLSFLLVDGGWSEWLVQYDAETCGATMRVKYRNCSNPPPRSGGRDCEGKGTVSERVNLGRCKSRDNIQTQLNKVLLIGSGLIGNFSYFGKFLGRRIYISMCYCLGSSVQSLIISM